MTRPEDLDARGRALPSRTLRNRRASVGALSVSPATPVLSRVALAELSSKPKRTDHVSNASGVRSLVNDSRRN
jgi:hypothetical protein